MPLPCPGLFNQDQNRKYMIVFLFKHQTSILQKVNLICKATKVSLPVLTRLSLLLKLIKLYPEEPVMINCLYFATKT